MIRNILAVLALAGALSGGLAAVTASAGAPGPVAQRFGHPSPHGTVTVAASPACQDHAARCFGPLQGVS
jgi:hypothetical protein